jgi:hypothetical protein
MLTDIATMFEGDLSPSWVDHITDWGEKVFLYRDYVKGEHKVYLTQTMMKMLNVTGQKHASFSADYTDMVVRMFSERLVVERIEAVVPLAGAPSGGDNTDEQTGSGRRHSSSAQSLQDKNPAQEWVDRLLKMNRFDALQADIHETAIGDGDAFVIVDFDEENQRARLNFNEAFDGDVGVIPIYSRRNPSKMIAAAKVFYIGETQKQVNIYYADRVEKYQTDASGSGLTAMGEPEKWLGGFPVVQFSNRKKRGSSVGISELQKMISLQDMLNRVLVSMTMASELSAFQVLFAKGFEPPSAIAPGAIIHYVSNDPAELNNVDLKAIPQGELTAFIEQINKLIDLIADITQTPIASVLGTSPSGEALKQRESWLLTKIRGAHIKFGNAWEDVLRVCHRVETAYKRVNRPPMIEIFDCQWMDASVRSDGDVIQQAGMVFDKTQDMAVYLEMVSPVTGWDEQKRQTILDNQQARSVETLNAMNLFGDAGDFVLNPNGVDAA